MRISRVLRALSACTLLIAASGSAAAQGPLTTALTYQGELINGGTPVNGTVDLRLSLYSARAGGTQIGATQCANDVQVADGRFVLSLDFGAVFTGQRGYLQLEVRTDTGLGCADASGFNALSPRQELTASPNASYSIAAGSAATANNATQLNGQAASFYTSAANLSSGTLPSARLNGTYSSALSLTNVANSFAGNGAGLTGLNASNLASGTLNAARMPSNWAAGGVLTGLFPNPSLASGVVTRANLATDVEAMFGTTTNSWEAPIELGFTATGGNSVAMTVVGTTAYVVSQGDDRLRLYNMSNPGAPIFIGTVATAIDPVAVAVSGTFAYTVNAVGLLQIFNVANPAAPVLTGSVDAGSFSTDVLVKGTVAYVTDRIEFNLKAIQVSNPAAPVVVTSQVFGDMPMCMASAGTALYVGTGIGAELMVFNAAVATAPVLVRSIPLFSPAVAMRTSGSSLFVLEQDGHLEVLTVAAPATPVLIGSVAGPAQPKGLAISGTNAFVIAGTPTSTFNVYDISTPAVPILLGSVSEAGTLASVGASATGAFACSLTPALIRSYQPGPVRTFAEATRFGRGLSASSLLSGRIPDQRLSGTYSSGLVFSNPSNVFIGSGAGLTDLSATNLTSGTLSDSLLSSFVARRNVPNAFTSTADSSFAGQLGIGITAPTAPLHIRGDTLRSRMVMDPGAANGIGEIGIYENTSTSLGSIIRYDGAGTNQLQIIGVNSGPTELILATFDRDGGGSVNVPVTFSAAGKAFRIDHPLDPTNKELWHSCVESPDMKNIYDGVVVTDSQGYATVELPEYFEALNSDFRYQMTVLDSSSFALVRVIRIPSPTRARSEVIRHCASPPR
ncbi:MAG: hypothetical protein NTV94_08445 [Planctomycetota bacterium]|nr:hypothetical protein [Planctomycetota bacterium]